MSDLELARAGLAAWKRDDFEALEELLAPEATWRAVEPGEWDCESRDDILRTLRERYKEGFTKGPLAPSRGQGVRLARGDCDRDHVPRWQSGDHAGPSNPGRGPPGL
jgi:hypothetical protein